MQNATVFEPSAREALLSLKRNQVRYASFEASNERTVVSKRQGNQMLCQIVGTIAADSACLLLYNLNCYTGPTRHILLLMFHKSQGLFAKRRFKVLMDSLIALAKGVYDFDFLFCLLFFETKLPKEIVDTVLRNVHLEGASLRWREAVQHEKFSRGETVTNYAIVDLFQQQLQVLLERKEFTTVLIRFAVY